MAREMFGKNRLPVTKKMVIIASIVIVILIGVTVTIIVLNKARNNTQASQTKKDVPSYQTVLPNGKTVDELNGWTRISPPGKDPVYAYKDSLDKVPIVVSEQPIPASFKDSIDAKLAELAKTYNATDQIDASGTKVYIGTSSKGPQSLIFEMNGLLVLIKSQQKVVDKNWIAYIQSLTMSDTDVKF